MVSSRTTSLSFIEFSCPSMTLFSLPFNERGVHYVRTVLCRGGWCHSSWGSFVRFPLPLVCRSRIHTSLQNGLFVGSLGEQERHTHRLIDLFGVPIWILQRNKKPKFCWKFAIGSESIIYILSPSDITSHHITSPSQHPDNSRSRPMTEFCFGFFSVFSSNPSSSNIISNEWQSTININPIKSIGQTNNVYRSKSQVLIQNNHRLHQHTTTTTTSTSTDIIIIIIIPQSPPTFWSKF